jgi:hypothetical protein
MDHVACFIEVCTNDDEDHPHRALVEVSEIQFISSGHDGVIIYLFGSNDEIHVYEPYEAVVKRISMARGVEVLLSGGENESTEEN